MFSPRCPLGGFPTPVNRIGHPAVSSAVRQEVRSSFGMAVRAVPASSAQFPPDRPLPSPSVIEFAAQTLHPCLALFSPYVFADGPTTQMARLGGGWDCQAIQGLLPEWRSGSNLHMLPTAKSQYRAGLGYHPSLDHMHGVEERKPIGGFVGALVVRI